MDENGEGRTDSALWSRYRGATHRDLPSDCPEPIDLACYVEGRAGEGVREAIESHLARCERCLDTALRMYESRLASPEGIPRETLDRIRTAFLSGLRDRRPPLHKRIAALWLSRPPAVRAALAACLVMLVGALPAYRLAEHQILKRTPVARVSEVFFGTVTVTRADRRFTFAKAKDCPPLLSGDVVRTDSDGACRIQWFRFTGIMGPDHAEPEPTFANVSPNAEMELRYTEHGRGRTASLKAGHLSAEVARQRKRIPIAFCSPHARFEVIGTAFTLSVSRYSSRMQVREGLVFARPLRDGDPIVVGPGSYAVACDASGISTGTIGREELENALVGEYLGRYVNAAGEAVEVRGKILPIGGWGYTLRLEEIGARGRHPRFSLRLDGIKMGDDLVFDDPQESNWKGRVSGELLTASDGRSGTGLRLVRVERHSPTLGMKPPPGATLLLPRSTGRPALEHWTNDSWRTLPGGVIEVTTGHNITKKSFKDMRLHLEFRVPPASDSGVYFHNRYEVQIRDSYLKSDVREECGAIWGVSGPGRNASLPAWRWQTYDIWFQAPRFSADGELVELPSLTVVHNGIRIHDRQVVPGPTGSSLGGGHVESAPMFLQDLGSPVQFRNIWVLEPDGRDSRRETSQTAG
jgi:hypothetical protein